MLVVLAYGALGVVVVLGALNPAAAYLAVATGLAAVIGSFAWFADRDSGNGPDDPDPVAVPGVEG